MYNLWSMYDEILHSNHIRLRYEFHVTSIETHINIQTYITYPSKAYKHLRTTYERVQRFYDDSVNPWSVFNRFKLNRPDILTWTEAFRHQNFNIW